MSLTQISRLGCTLFCVCALLLFGNSLQAQVDPFSDGNPTPVTPVKKAPEDTKKVTETVEVVTLQDTTTTPMKTKLQPAFSIGLIAGSQGGGLQLGAVVHPRIGISVGFNYLSFAIENYEIDGALLGYDGQTLLVTMDSRLNAIPVRGHFLVNKKQNFRLVAGMNIALNNAIDTRLTFRDGLQINDYIVAPEDIGFIQSTYTTSSAIMPYAGLGIGSLVPQKRVAVNFGLGALYRGKPAIAITSSKLLEDNSHLGPALANKLSDLAWYPDLHLGIVVRLN